MMRRFITYEFNHLRRIRKRHLAQADENHAVVNLRQEASIGVAA